MSHTASVTWHDVIYVEYCLWIVLYIIWISQLTCVKCPLPPKMCYLASSWFASCLSNCAPIFSIFPHILKSSAQCFWRVLHWNLLFTSWGWVCVIFLNNAETQAACSTALTLFRLAPSAVSKDRGGAHCAPPSFLRVLGGCGLKF
jgi:hypothetical protein